MYRHRAVKTLLDGREKENNYITDYSPEWSVGRKEGESFHGIDFSLVLCFSFPDNKNPCHLSEAPGPCRGLLSRYYYDSKSQQCTHFFYGGCFGNANNFRSTAECQAKCQSPGRSICLDTTSTVLKAWKMMSFLNKMGWAKTFFFAVIDE